MSQTEVDKLFPKKYTCPVCNHHFEEKTVRTGKARLIHTDMDLRNVYEGIEPLKYDVVICPRCGYGALTRFFQSVTPIQQQYIEEKISPHFKLLPEKGEIYTYDQALSRYKVAFANAVVKMAKMSEGAYISLKTGWLCRSYRESLEKEKKQDTEKYQQLLCEERTYLKQAYDLFTKAVTEESFPMCGMDETMVDYIMAVLAMEFEEYSVSSKLLSKLLASYSISARLKERARDAKEELRKRMNAAGEEE